MDLRCDNWIKFGDLDVEAGVLAVKCRSKLCGAAIGVVVIHEFDIHTGNKLRTRVFRDPLVS